MGSLATIGATSYGPNLGIRGEIPALALQFAGASALDSRIAFTRASAATYTDSAGVLQTASTDAPRFDYDPSTLTPLGLLLEEGRTNSIRNNTMVGAVAGTPGTLPTNWVDLNAGGLTRTVVGTGIVNGIPYVDLRYAGTSSTTFVVSGFDNSTTITVNPGEVWTQSFWVALVGGSMANISAFQLQLRWTSAGTVDITSVSTPTSSLTRFSHTKTAPALTAAVQPCWSMAMTSGAAIDFTIRIGMPQLELGGIVTSVIPTSTVAVTRSADVASMSGTNFSSWYNQTEGSFVYQANLANTTSDAVDRVLLGVSATSIVNESMYLMRAASSNNIVANIVDGGVGQWGSNAAGATSAGANFKHAMAYKLNDCAQSLNGGTINSDAIATLPTVDLLRIGSAPWASGSYANGHIASVDYYARRLTNDQLRVLSGP